jgi:hypothetical protein
MSPKLMLETKPQILETQRGLAELIKRKESLPSRKFKPSAAKKKEKEKPTRDPENTKQDTCQKRKKEKCITPKHIIFKL